MVILGEGVLALARLRDLRSRCAQSDLAVRRVRKLIETEGLLECWMDRTHATDRETSRLLTVLTQVLANSVTRANDEFASLVWPTIQSAEFVSLCERGHTAPRLLIALAVLVYNSIRQSAARSVDFADFGGRVLHCLLLRLHEAFDDERDEQELLEWTHRIVRHVCCDTTNTEEESSEGTLSRVFCGMPPCVDIDRVDVYQSLGSFMTVPRLSLLQLVERVARDEKINKSNLVFCVDVLRLLDLQQVATADEDKHMMLEALFASLNTLADCTSHQDNSEYLLAHAPHLCASVGDLTRQVAALDSVPEPSLGASNGPKSNEVRNSPPGLRTLCVRILANLTFCEAAEEAFLHTPRLLETVLEQGRMDAHNFTCREWAMLAVRNLTFRSAAIRQRLSDLQIIPGSVANEDELREMGLQARVDENGRVRVSRVPPEST
ncbi:MAG: hypothetical protein MHM6MM_004238 [Cercozoa sp. M6MM]